MSTDRVEELVDAWRLARNRGSPATVADLCRACPELAPAVAKRIAALKESSANSSGAITLASTKDSHGGDAPASQVDSLPVSLGGYRIERLLGQGGMASVLLAHDDRLRRVVALKIMKPEVISQPEARDRFLREARAAAQVEHDNIIAIWQVGEDSGIPFIAMPLLQGESLACRLQRERVSPLGVILKIGREVAEGLAAAHARGLIHRDIKPANVWLEGDLNSTEPAARLRRCKILDFGLVRLVHDDAHLTATGVTVGTPAYMSPEQAAGGPVDFRTDLFSLGVLLYRMAAGELPFAGSSVLAVLTSLAVHQPSPPTRKNSALPPPVSDLIMRLLAKNPAGRPASAREVATAIREIARQWAASRKAETAMPTATPSNDATMPMPTVPAKDVWNEICADVTTPHAPALADKPAPNKKWISLTIVLFAIATMVAAGVVVLKGKGLEGKATSVGSNVKGDKKENLLAELPKDAKPLPKPSANPAPKDGKSLPMPVATAAYRSAAEWALERGGKVLFFGADTMVTAVKDLPAGPFLLTRVVLDGCGDKVTDAGLERLTGLTGITHLYLRGTPITDAGLDHVKGLTSLVDLRLPTRITDAGVERLRGLTGLANLSLVSTEVTNAGLEHLRGMEQLQDLDLDGTKITDAGLKHLKAMPRLSILSLINTGVTDAGLDLLRQQPAIASLNLDGTDVTDAGLAKLKDFPALTELGVSDLGVTDAGLEHLKGMSKLTRLVVGGPRVTNAGLAHVKGLDKLTQFSLGRSSVTDAGLEHLTGLANLTELLLHQNKITPAGVEKLRRALPKCKVDFVP